MADMEGFQEAKAYGLGTPQKNEAFFLKGNENRGWGVKNRLSRIFNPKSGHTVMLAFDHGFIMGPTSGLERIDLTINPLIEYADCLMCTRGVLRSVVPPTTSKPVCLRADGGTSILTDLNLNRLYDIEDVLRVNASAMALMVACGDKASEQITTHNLVQAVDFGEKYGIGRIVAPCVIEAVIASTMPKQWNIGTWIIMRSAVERPMRSPMHLPLLTTL